MLGIIKQTVLARFIDRIQFWTNYQTSNIKQYSIQFRYLLFLFSCLIIIMRILINLTTRLRIILLLLLLIQISKQCQSSEYSANGICIACSVTCLTCTSSATTSCLSCVTSRYITSQTSCQCLDGYIENSPVAGDCVQIICDYSCATCNNSATMCTSCSSADHRVYASSLGSCPCISNYYDDGSATCFACDYSCSQCNGNKNDQCTSCNLSAYRNLSGSVCSCLDGYFDKGSITCSICNHQCATCDNSKENCITCGGNREAIPSCLCLQGFYDDGISLDCLACGYSCQSCSNGFTCDQCNISNLRELSNKFQCLCLDKYYDSGSSDCVSCDPRCTTCRNGSNCMTCNSSANRIYQPSTQLCICIAGYFETSTSIELCSECDSLCLTCQGNSSKCTSCDSSISRVLASGACLCMTGFYQDSSISCLACDSSCFSCSSGNACIDCVNTTLQVINSSNLCSCSLTMFYNTTTNICQSCSYQCYTCNPTSGTLCLQCPNSSYRTLNINSSTCPCNVRFYDDGSNSICQSCDYSCYTCSSSLNSTCLTCNTSAFRFYSTGSCLCRVLYFDDGSLELCQPCLYSCQTCQDSVSCLTCNSAKYRILDIASSPNTCLCMSFYFQDATKKCAACLYNCQTCNSLTTCLTCNISNFRIMNTTTNKCSCMQGYYDNFVNQTCLLCLPQCLTCTNSTVCTSCNISLYRLISSIRLCPCLDKYYDLNVTCLNCFYSCKTCQAANTCTSCNNTSFRSLNSLNSCICLAKYYDDGVNQLCLPCSYACLTCATQSTNCVTCEYTLRSLVNGWCTCAQYYYDNNSTVACPACSHTCSTCLSNDSCSTCNSTKFRVFDSLNQYCVAMIGYYEDGKNQICPPCSYRCVTCVNSSQCQTCNSLKFRYLPASLCPCIDRYYDDGLNQLCPPCQYSCSKCVNSTSCTNCQSIINFRMMDTNNLCKCLDGYYDDGLNNEQCLACIYSCLTCVHMSTTCTSCNSTADRILNAGTCNCMNHFYDNLIVQCFHCQYSCLTCTSSSACVTCNASSHRIMDTATQLCACMDMFFDDFINQACIPCEPTCLTCSSLSTCITCNLTRNRMLNNSIDFYGGSSLFCVCLYRYYSPDATQDCIACHYSCQVCNGPASNNCLQCNQSSLRYYLAKSTSCLCPNGYYDTNVTQVCQLCNQACTSCLNGSTNACFSCNASLYLLIEQTSCFQTCPDYYHNILFNRTCQSCSLHCLNCLNNTYCMKCENNSYLYNNICYSSCPLSTYTNYQIGVCIDCPSGCLVCSGNSQCSACVNRYYYDSSIQFCFACNYMCLTCTGPGQNQCLSCASPLYLKENTCTVIICPFGTYIDPQSGCISCFQLFSYSQSCNISLPLSCNQNYMLIDNSCIYCTNIAGYMMKDDGKCGDICGDGILIDLQCDDGNTISGDGCSSNCVIEKGWACNLTNSTSTKSLCSLIDVPVISVIKFSKQGGSNKINAVLEMSLPILFSHSNLFIAINGLSTNSYSYTVKQQQSNLSVILVTINYQEDLQGKVLLFSYNQSIRLLTTQNERSSRLLQILNFNNSFTVTTYPPAIYYSDVTISQFKLLKYCLTVLMACILVFSFILVPKRMHLHSLTFVYIPAQILITYGVIGQKYTDWVKYALQDCSNSAMIGGFHFGSCCTQTSQFFGLSSQVTKFSGVIVIIMVTLLILLIGLHLYHRFCLKIPKIIKMAKYFTFTLLLSFIFSLTYSSTNALHNFTLFSHNDAFNTLFATILEIFILCLILSLWIITSFTKYIQNTNSSVPRSEKQLHFTLPVQSLDAFDLPRGKHNIFDIEEDQSQRTSYQRYAQQQNKVNSILNHFIIGLQFDYISLYSSSKLNQHIDSSKAKYFLPFLLTKIYLTALLSSALGTFQLQFFIYASIIEIMFSIFIIKVRPFESNFTNVRLIIISFLFLVTNIIFSIYLALSKQFIYIRLYEQVIIYLIIAIAGIGVLLLVLEHCFAWKKELWKMLQPCLKRTRLVGIRKNAHLSDQNTENSKKASTFMNYDDVKIRDSKEEQQFDAFYARVLKKDELKKKYRRERFIR